MVPAPNPKAATKACVRAKTGLPLHKHTERLHNAVHMQSCQKRLSSAADAQFQVCYLM